MGGGGRVKEVGGGGSYTFSHAEVNWGRDQSGRGGECDFPIFNFVAHRPPPPPRKFM